MTIRDFCVFGLVLISSGICCLSAAPAARPTVFLDSTYVPPTGNSIAVDAGGNLQTALNAALYGDEIVIAAGATFSGNYILPQKTGTGWITIRGSNSAGLPPAGVRISPGDSSSMPKLVSDNLNPAIATDAGNPANSAGHHYRLMGLEITISPKSPGLYSIIEIDTTGAAASSLPTDIIIDRCYIHGNGAS